MGICVCVVTGLLCGPVAFADAATGTGDAPASGGATAGPQQAPKPPADAPTSGPTVPGSVAQLVNGVAAAPQDAPLPVQQAIWSGNQIQTRPYRYGGGHGSFKDTGYDCSGTVSYALHGGGLVDSPLDSSDFAQWGTDGSGQWITVYTNPGHAYVIIAGLRLDTSAEGSRDGAPNTPAPSNGAKKGARVARVRRHANGTRQARRPQRDASSSGPRWRSYPRSPAGYVARHPYGL
ncbi:MAG TPA: hypothetical protein VHE14_09670 [Solirubrobacteraceae bacterium]|nr:hypothetical protein [Solirubrobacteraceae bacterium]